MTKLCFFLGEEFLYYEGSYYTSSSSLDFLERAFYGWEWEVVTHVKHTTDQPSGKKISPENIVELPYYKDIGDFVRKIVLDGGFRRKYFRKIYSLFGDGIERCFWVRNPTFSSLLFSLILINKNKAFVSHLCADIRIAWRSPKYKGMRKLAAFLFSKVMHFLLVLVVKSKMSYNLVTGSMLHNFSLRWDKEAVFFVDSVARKFNDGFSGESKNNEFIELLFVGRVREDKGVFDVIEAMNIINKTIDARLVVIGEGELERLESEAEKFNVSKSVKILGALPSNELGVHYNSADCIVVPSDNDYEGFPRVILEAWANQKPVFLCPVGGIPGLAKNEHNSIFVERGCSEDIAKKILYFFSKEGAVLRHKVHVGVKQAATKFENDYWYSLAVDAICEVLEKKSLGLK